MEDYFYFTLHHTSTGDIRFIGDVAEHRWESWEEAVESVNGELNMPDKSEWKICGDKLVANWKGSSIYTIQLNNTGYEEWLKD